MKSHLTAVLVGAALVGMSIAAIAHHSFAMFDQANPTDLAGVVKDWKYTAPHVFVVLEVKEADGTTQVWNLEGNTPSALARDGWTLQDLEPRRRTNLEDRPIAQWRTRRRVQHHQGHLQGRQLKDGSPIVPSH